jgi:hypothetical protein
VSGWLAACEVLVALDVQTVVPGHGPVGDISCVHETAYPQFVHDRATSAFTTGVEPHEAA